MFVSVRSEQDLNNDDLEFSPEFTHQIFGEKYERKIRIKSISLF